MSWRVELHCHSQYSRDCRVSLKRLIELCKARRIDAIALTDHNEVAGAQELARIAPDWLKVIVGEEVASKEGDVIGLFLKEKIPARLPIEETIAEIHRQGGVVLLPHPTDRIRREAVGLEVADRIKSDIDFIEIFNARTILPADNTAVAAFAKTHNLPSFVGSDAHTSPEYGKALNIMEAFTDAAGFTKSLKAATFEYVPSSIVVHLETAIVKRVKKLKASRS